MNPSSWSTLIVAAALLAPFGGKAHRKAEQGNRLYAQGEWAEALAAYTEAQVAAPESPELHYDIGNVLYRQGDFEGAADAYTRALLSAPQSLAPRVAYNLGNAKFQLGAFDEAVTGYRRALRLDPGDTDAKRNLELALRALEQQRQQQQDSQQPPPDDGSEQSEPQDAGQQGDQGQQEPQPNPPQSSGSSDSEQDPAEQAARPQGMTAEQAERLLDELAEEEQKQLRQEGLARSRAKAAAKEKDW